jgi:carbon monoxide dehydrogenase subunit G
MEFDNSFEVPLPPAQAWTLLMDIERIAPCMPGARLTEVVDEKTYKGNIAVRLGPVALTFAGTVVFEALDEASHTARVRAQGTDAKGRGGAHAVATFRLEPSADGSRVTVHTDLSLSGAVAQYGRGVGMIQSTAAQLMKQFAAALRAQVIADAGVAAPQAAAEAPPPTQAPVTTAPTPSAGARPISGLSLLARVVWDAIVRLFTRRSERV